MTAVRPPVAIWLLLILPLSAARPPIESEQPEPVRVIQTLDGKLINQPVIVNKGKSFIKIFAKGKAQTIEIVDEQNLLKRRPDIPLQFTAESIGNNKAKITDVKLTAVVQLQSYIDKTIDPKNKHFVSETSKAIEELDKVSKEALLTGDKQKVQETAAKIEDTKRAIVKDYANTPADKNEVKNTLGVAKLITNYAEKAYYGRDDNYRPEVYQMIYRLSRSCVGITPHDKIAPKGSGVLIGPNTVLTAKHVIEDAPSVSDFDTIFDYEQMFDSRAKQMKDLPCVRRRVVKAYFIGSAPDNDSSPLDYVLLQIQSVGPPQARSPVTISTVHIPPETPIFLVGHPRQQPRLVHDNSWVKFPYIVTEREYKTLLTEVNGEFKVAGIKNPSQAVANSFGKCYHKHTDPDNGTVEYTHVDVSGGMAVHCMGAECDTFHGDSGAPAMLRESGELVGILTAGQPDQEDIPGEGRAKSNAYVPGWLHHEIITPMKKIVEQLDKQKPNWKHECGVTVIY